NLLLRPTVRRKAPAGQGSASLRGGPREKRLRTICSAWDRAASPCSEGSEPPAFISGIIAIFGRMASESKRQQKFARLIQKDLGDIFQREMQNILPNVMVTVTTVRASPDLSTAKVYLSFYNTADARQAINAVKLQAGEIRYKLGKRIRNQVRVIPELEFFVDDTNEYVARMDKLFNEIRDKEDE
ncbi:MAG TPA: 30S ribosome-binding factor RbfA, partial [Anseongella sp.]|nr:30S ribosome-binding factor RbfA [Anseongella sp.]